MRRHTAALQHNPRRTHLPPLLPSRSGFGEAAPELLRHYSVPPIFAHDLFAPLGYRREDYRQV